MKAPVAKIHGLAAYRLSLSRLKSLGARPVGLSIQLKGLAVARLAKLRPKERRLRNDEACREGLKRLRRRWPEIDIEVRGAERSPRTLDAVVPAAAVARLAAESAVSYVWVQKVRGLPRRRQKRRKEFFCVWGSVAIQVEGRRRGLVDVEDRLVLVKAFSPGDAQKRLLKAWRQYAEPYLNYRGELVRWQLVEVLDVYSVWEDEIDPAGTEVYSRIRSKRMKRKYRWGFRAKGA